MKCKKILIGGTSALLFLLSACGPIYTAGPDVVVGGGIYPTPVLNPPLGYPYAFRPGGPSGPGFAPGWNKPGRPNNPDRPGNPVPGNPGNSSPGSPGNPGNMNHGQFSTPGNQRQPGTGLGIGGGNQPNIPNNVGGNTWRGPGGGPGTPPLK